MLDVVLLVPWQARPSIWSDPGMRTSLAPTQLVSIRARDRFLEQLGADLDVENAPSLGEHRSLTAVALATSLERAGLRWHAIDPGRISLQDWRRRLLALRALRPRLLALSTTFITDGIWLAGLCDLVRRILPDAVLAVGGYYYATDARCFLSLDADILCVGEGEVRIVSITEAIRDGRPLDAIQGLYLRDRAGQLRYTGDVEPLDLAQLPLPDWSLSRRMDPPLDPARDDLDFPTETQRGCVFKCEFCTFRTLAAPTLASVDRAAERILHVARNGKGAISLIDATATYPRERWRRILQRLIESGERVLPVSVYARVTDLDDEVAELMARAGVRFVRIGQETGDQEQLNRMRKGTRVDQVAPAIAALGRHGLRALVFMIYGFPGETEASLAASRRLLAEINPPGRPPVVQTVRIGLFDQQDFAGIGQREQALGGKRFDWRSPEVTPARAWEAALETFLELSRSPDAPYTGFESGAWLWQFAGHSESQHHDPAFFDWAKALDRGIGLFVEQELEGTRPDARELSRCRQRVLLGLPFDLRRDRVARRWLQRAKNRATWQLIGEWTREREAGVGPLTRVALGLDVARATGRAQHAWYAFRHGRYPTLGFTPSAPDEPARSAAADQLIRFGTATGNRRLPRSL